MLFRPPHKEREEDKNTRSIFMPFNEQGIASGLRSDHAFGSITERRRSPQRSALPDEDVTDLVLSLRFTHPIVGRANPV
jgi:hypothetical protein